MTSPDTPKRKPKITPDQLDRIIALRLSGVSVRDTAKRVGVTPRTVQERYTQYLAEVKEQRAEMLEQEREEALARIERAASAAWQAWETSTAAEQPDPRFLAEYRQAMAQAERLRGLQVAKVEHTGTVTVDATDAKQALLDRLAQLTPQDTK